VYISWNNKKYFDTIDAWCKHEDIRLNTTGNDFLYKFIYIFYFDKKERKEKN
jgi:hypothetical protein